MQGRLPHRRVYQAVLSTLTMCALLLQGGSVELKPELDNAPLMGLTQPVIGEANDKESTHQQEEEKENTLAVGQSRGDYY